MSNTAGSKRNPCKCEKTFIPMTLEIEPKINIIVNEPDICIKNKAICSPSSYKSKYEKYEQKRYYTQSGSDTGSDYSECSSCYVKKSRRRYDSYSSNCSSCHKKMRR